MKVFRGWWIVVAAVVGQAFSVGTLLVYTFGVLAKPLAAAFHATRGEVALAVSLLDVAVLLSSPAAGRLVDRGDARRIVVASMVALGLCVAALSRVTPPLWHLYAAYALAGVLGSVNAPVAYGKVVANWFDRRRGLALGIAGTGIGLGAFVMPSFAQALLERGGTPAAYVGLGLVTILLGAPPVAALLRGRPEDVGLTADGAARGAAPPPPVRAPGASASVAVRSPTFWALCAAFFCVAACANGSIAHLAPMLTDAGVSGRAAAAATSVFGAATVVARVGNGYLLDRFFAPRVAAASFGGAIVGAAILASGATGAAPFVAAALLGLAIGAETDVMPYLVSRYFGMRSMATVLGATFGSYVLGNAVGRYLLGVGFDCTGGYRVPLAVAGGLLLLATVLMLRLPRYPGADLSSAPRSP